MIGKVQQDSFPSLRIRIDTDLDVYEPSQSGFGSPGSPGESLLPRDCRDSLGFPLTRSGLQTTSPSPQQQQPNSSRYKTEMCRPYQEHGMCKYGEKCQFAHGSEELRSVNRHPKYKTDMCRTYHSVGFCPYGPRCHFIHALDEIRPTPTTPEKKSGVVKQLPMFGGPNSNNTSNVWSFPDSDMKNAVAQLNNYFNVGSGGRNSLNSFGSSDSSRSGSFCSDIDSPTSSSPPPSFTEKAQAPRLPIFSRLA